MSWNNIVGSLPSSFGDLNSLGYLDLSNNNLTGELPQKLVTDCYFLYLLKLSNNKFQGQIFPGAIHTFELAVLQLDNNNFVGKIPDSLSTLSFCLETLDLSNNHLHGELPKWIGNMTYLLHLSVYSNQLEGPFPTQFCMLEDIQLLDISDNKLSGSIPSCFNPETITHFYLSNNWFGGQLTDPFCNNSSSLRTLDLSRNNFRGTIPKWISDLVGLIILLLKGNHFEGIIPNQLCQLTDLSILDLSCNNLTGSIPRCLGEMMTSDGLGSFNTDLTSEEIDNPMTDATDSYLETSKFAMTFHLPLATIFNNEFNIIDNQNIRAEFTTKLQAHSFQGIVLEYMSGIDLSCNQLTGNILPDLGNLSKIYALNLSHNNLTGSIPITLSGLAKIESLDLSYNKLNGRIPAQLIALNFLEVFSVAHNNLSGPIPDRKAQFATFDASSYEGNALLCGPPLSNLCTHKELSPPQVLLHENGEEESNFMDMKSFYISFLIAYTVMLVTVVAVLCINPYWRRTWFSFIEFCAMSCYDYVWIAFLKFKLRMRSLRSRFM
nr:LRR receptor-like serine/threonine-protein kinase [Ipomoea batatas]